MKKSFYQKIASDLKKSGLITYDLRKPLSSGQKSYVTRQAKKFKHFLAHPEKFHTVSVSPKTQKALKGSGYEISKTGRAIIPLHNFQKAVVRRNSITYTHIDPRDGTVTTEQTFLVGAKDFHKKLFELSKKKLDRNQRITAQIGNNSPFNARFLNYSDLYKYVTEFKPKEDIKEELMRRMSIVTVTKVPGKKKNAAKTKGTPTKTRKGRK